MRTSSTLWTAVLQSKNRTVLHTSFTTEVTMPFPSDLEIARADLRRLPEQTATTEEIRTWVSGLLGHRGSIASFDLKSADDELSLRVDFDGRTGHLTFCFLRSWSNVEPRDELAGAVLEVLRGRDDFDHEFWLSGYAESSYITSDRYRSDRNH